MRERARLCHKERKEKRVGAYFICHGREDDLTAIYEEYSKKKR